MRTALGALALLLAASLAHAEVEIYTGSGTISGDAYAGDPGNFPIYHEYSFEYEGPMRMSYERRPYECDGVYDGEEHLFQGVTLGLGSWVRVQTGETGESSGGCWAWVQRHVPPALCHPREVVSIRLGPAGVSHWFGATGASFSGDGSRLLADLSVYGDYNGAGFWHFSGTRSEFFLSTDTRTLDLGSEGGWVIAEVWTDGSIRLDEIDLTSLRLAGAPASSARIESERIVAQFPEAQVGADLSVGPDIPITLAGRLLDGLPFTVSDTIQVIDPSRTMFYVDTDATWRGDGSSWTDAYVDLQDALRRMEFGDEVWVAEGVYKPTIGGDQTVAFTLVDGAKMYGGFSGVESSVAQRDPQTHETILSGDLGVERTEDDYPEYGAHAVDNSNQVVVARNVGAETTLDGFTITACRTFNSDAYGEDEPAGMRLVDSEPMLANLVFRELGGVSAMRNIRSAPAMQSVVFADNICYVTGGMWNTDSDPVVRSGYFVGNGARWSTQAGAVVNDNSSPLFINTTFNNNGTDGGGGGAMINTGTSAPVLVSVLFSNNPFGAISHFGENMRLINVTFAGNRGPIWNDGAVLYASGPCEIRNAMFAGNTLQYLNPPIGGKGAVRIANSLIEGSGGSGPSWNSNYGIDLGGNIDLDPLFVNPEAGDYHLAPGSPCIDVGDICAVPEGVATDLGDNPRVCGATVDMGAYEYQGPGPNPLFAAHFTPATLNLASQGSSVQVTIRPLREVLPTEIVEGSVALLDSISPLPGAVKVGKAQLKAKFDRASVVSSLASGERVPVVISGLLQDGRKFVAADTVRVIGPESQESAAWAKGSAIGSDLVTAPRRYLTAAPNPFNPSTTIYYGVTEPGHVELTIYDLAGRRVTTLVSGHVIAGDHEVSWDGRDHQGRPVASGVYLYRLEADEFVDSKRMVLVK